MTSGWLYCDESANLWLKSHNHGPGKLTERDREDIFSSVFAEIAVLRTREDRRQTLAPLSPESYEENLLQHGIIR